MAEVFTVHWMPAASVELIEAAEYLEDCRPGAGDRLIDKVESMVKKATLMPWVAPPLGSAAGHIRYLPVPRTRYVLFFEIHESARRLDVLHVLHEW